VNTSFASDALYDQANGRESFEEDWTNLCALEFMGLQSSSSDIAGFEASTLLSLGSNLDSLQAAINKTDKTLSHGLSGVGAWID